MKNIEPRFAPALCETGAMAKAANIRVEQAQWPQDQERLRGIRAAVFVEELGIPAHLEWDGRDEEALHLLAWSADGAAAGTARLLPDGRIGRMAVLPAYRGNGIGTALLQALLELARSQGLRELRLHAQVPAIPFYSRFGFEAEGTVFEEAGIAHQSMRLTVQ